MARVKATVQYIGTNYCGFQVQPNGISVQSVLEKALGEFFNAEIKITASGRTDAGVHALAQVIHFDINNDFPIERLPMAIESFLPNDISIIDAVKVKSNFHARFDCVSKTYEYYMVQSKIKLPIYYNRAYICEYELDLNKMVLAAELMTGRNDYKAFMAAGSNVIDTVREVKEFVIDRIGDNILRFRVTANGFLYNMVRNMVGTLIDVGRGKKSIKDVGRIMASRDRRNAGSTAPACGLYLVEAKY